MELHTDASGAKGIAQRRGLGKLRHADVHLVWLQQQVASGVFKISKVEGNNNPADLLAKYLCQDVTKTYMRRLHYSQAEGSAAVCPQLSSDVNV